MIRPKFPVSLYQISPEKAMKQEREVEQESDEEEEITVDVPYQYEDFEIVEKEV